MVGNRRPFCEERRVHRLVFAALVLLLACDRPREAPVDGADAQGHTAPSAHTMTANAAVAQALPLADRQDFEDAQRGLVASDPEIAITGADGRRIWRTADYAFVTGDAPPSVNPSLWRQAKLNGIHGLFEVAPGIHQVRGYDLANMTIIDGKTGWIVVDPLGSRETATAALALATRHLGPHPIRAVIFTHSHVDHFGGIEGILPDAAARAGVRIIAPKGFIEEATSENVLAGIAMGRRASFMYGMPLARGPRGHVDTGLGKEPSRGTFSIIEATELIDHTPQPLDVDGVPFVFQYAPASEAPAELTFYLPDAKAFCAAEVTSHNLHNLYTLRGAKVRDALRWSGYIDEAIRFFPDVEVVFASHHWPVWDRVRVRTFLEQQRDVYRYIHDQTLRLANGGFTPREIAEQLVLPSSLRTVFANRDYYGTVRHNAKAVYQNYFGWYDGNPANLDPLPPAEESVRYVEAMGGAAAVVERAHAAADRGEYRWAATLLNHVVFAEPSNTDARERLAAVYDQLGYQAESGPWRDEYLTSAYELRHGVQPPIVTPADAANLLLHLPLADFFASMAARIDGPAADGTDATFNLTFSDLGENWVLTLKNAVLHAHQESPAANADATVTLTRPFLVRLVTGQSGLRELVFSDELHVDGSRMALLSFLRLLERPGDPFPIVTP
jgi:alkyl sulfatase BDS1-like metallo-beta-lactamase superfamily hydrolase